MQRAWSITIAVLTLLPAASIARAASSRLTPVTVITVRRLRSTSFSLVAMRSTIMFSYTLPTRTKAAVVIMFSTSFCAVPDFMRVEPMSASGPTSGQIATSTSSVNSERGVHVT